MPEIAPVTWPDAVKAVPDLIKEVYHDLAKPGVSQVGTAVGHLMGLGTTALWPIALLNGKADIALRDNLEKYRKKLESVPTGSIVAVPPETGVPILERMQYTSDPMLIELYLSVLVKAATKEHCSLAHPSFANTIANMSPDDARLFALIVKENQCIAATAQLITKQEKSNSFLPEDFAAPFREIQRGLLEQRITMQLAFPSNAPAYIGHLEGLGLVSLSEGTHLSDNDERYEALSESYRATYSSAVATIIRDNENLKFVRSMLSVTTFGRMFAHAVDPVTAFDTTKINIAAPTS
jgi:Abortive infection alpha